MIGGVQIVLTEASNLKSLQEQIGGLHAVEEGQGSFLALTAGRQHMCLECCACKLFMTKVLWAEEVL